MTICVPTIVVDNRGLPHTLEHLVLCVYTNGSTEKDQTYYEATAAGEEAIGNILPVFLDHVLNPLLSEDQFLTEVYHFDASGKERGVVFSEMIMRDYRETDLMSIGLGKLVYSEKSTYAFESGGLTKDIATLTNQDIIDYHRRFYDPNNITVLLVGSFSDSFEDVLQQLPADLLASRGCDSRGKLEQERRDTEQRNAASISDREKHTQRIERAVEASKFSVPDEVKRGIRTPDALKIASLLHTHEVLELPTPIGPAVVAQLIEVATEFPALSINIPLPNLPDNLRSVLTLFKELILATDLILPPGIAWSTEPSDTARRIDYNAFNRHLSNATVFYKASIGQTTDLFSVDFKSTHENLHYELGEFEVKMLDEL
ncbi:hypothetical protein FBU59_000311 [Linderina macrospora]|uniref:Uncharacterized protein n=1 Tax=Linderina macrospora TaxID=4868 RepID=A0ACC1JGZ6_9FUNG|nr:hypothetical protein FBU59_000311 [Linderina macrospora]